MAASPKSPKSPAGLAKAASPKSPTPPAEAHSSPASAETGAESNAPIAVDENVDEGLDLDSIASSSVSLSSSIMRFRKEHGHTYHAYKDGAYVYPNDNAERERLDLQHAMFYATFDGKLFLNPADPKKLHRVLDCGTGTGSWVVDFADEFPNAQVIGVDLSPIQPSFVPPNVQFFVDDVEDHWTYNHPFDLIYGRVLTGSIADWPKLVKQAYDNLAPGGYFELADLYPPWKSDDGTLTEDSAINQWSVYCLEASKKLGRPINSAETYAELMREAGFVNVVERKFKWPSNHWPKDRTFKEIGMWMYENIGKNLHGLTVAPFTRGLGWTPEQCEVFLVDVRKDFKNPSIHGYLPVYVVYGQKPLTA